MQRGKEIKIENVANLNVTFGTVDNKNPKSVYINISGWGELYNDEDVDYNKVIRHTRKKLKQQIFKHANKDLFNLKKTIIDFNMRESGINYGKKSYMSCEINLFQNKNFNIFSSELHKALEEILNIITLDNLNKHDYFKFYKTKD